jgi:RimJ/RimL family protein N-acetyltransferase
VASSLNYKSIGVLKKLGMSKVPDADFIHPSFTEDSAFKVHEVYSLINEKHRI